ncbi:MAG: pyridoxine 5'-phosphate synthase [Roseibacillus sp.]
MGLLLGVNIDHVATLRQARYATMLDSPNAEPSLLEAALAAKAGGADSITMHVRGDRRHVQEQDVRDVMAECELPLNFEMASTAEMVGIALKLAPDFVCLVPENRQEISTEGGLDVAGQLESLRTTVATLQAAGSKLSMFIDPESEQVQASAELGAEMIELHTGCFANAEGEERAAEVARLADASRLGQELGLQVNAGHGINYHNLSELFPVPNLVELNTGHSIVTRAILVGLEQAVREMVELMAGYPEA